MNYIGQGTDTHKTRFTFKKNKIMVGGICITCNRKVIAHSDGDVVYHSIANAILGACQGGDIGEHFADTNPKNKNMDSKIIIQKALEILANMKLTIVNVDLTIVCQKIYLKDYKKQIAQSISNITKCKKVNVKATRFEKNNNMIQCESIVLVAQI